MKRSHLIAVIGAVALIATAGGYIVGRSSTSSDRQAPEERVAAAAPPVEQVYTCSMHPQIRLPQPGNCPICEMPLIPAATATAAAGEVPTLQLSDHALAMASVETVPLERRSLSRIVRAVGKIEYNESSLATITPRAAGYAERLFVNFTGVEIRKGDHLVEVYSPELLVAQRELLIALQGGASAPLVEVAKTRLRFLGLTDEQIQALVDEEQPTDRVTLYSPISGTVIEKGIIEKAAFEAGDVLYRIANLDSVWVYLDLYEYDLPWVRYGQNVRLTAEGVPGRAFAGLVTFVQPIVNDPTRTIRVPVHIENTDHVLKPGMFVTAEIDAVLGADGSVAPTGVEGRYSCPMHPQVLADAPGACPICEMPLEKIPGEPAADEHTDPAASTAPAEPPAKRYFCPMKCEGEKTYEEPGRCPVCNMRLEEAPAAPAHTHEHGLLAIPISAVLDSGTRRIAYVEKSPGLFEPRELTLGPRAGDFFAVLAGAQAGERVVTRGNFLIDSQFQVTGHPSLFYPGGLHAAMGHDHGATGETPAPDAADQPTAPAQPAHKH